MTRGKKRGPRSSEIDENDWTDHDDDVQLQARDIQRQRDELRKKLNEVRQTCDHSWVYIDKEDTGKDTWLGHEWKNHFICEICDKQTYDYYYTVEL